MRKIRNNKLLTIASIIYVIAILSMSIMTPKHNVVVADGKVRGVQEYNVQSTSVAGDLFDVDIDSSGGTICDPYGVCTEPPHGGGGGSSPDYSNDGKDWADGYAKVGMTMGVNANTKPLEHETYGSVLQKEDKYTSDRQNLVRIWRHKISLNLPITVYQEEILGIGKEAVFVTSEVAIKEESWVEGMEKSLELGIKSNASAKIPFVAFELGVSITTSINTTVSEMFSHEQKVSYEQVGGVERPEKNDSDYPLWFRFQARVEMEYYLVQTFKVLGNGKISYEEKFNQWRQISGVGNAVMPYYLYEDTHEYVLYDNGNYNTINQIWL